MLSFEYAQHLARYQSQPIQRFPVRLGGDLPWIAVEIATEIKELMPRLGNIAHYLAALVTGDKSETLIAADGRYTFASKEVALALSSDQDRQIIDRFFSVPNLLRAYGPQHQLQTILTRFRDRIEPFGEMLLRYADENLSTRDSLLNRERETRALIGVKDFTPLVHTRTLMRNLYDAQEWELLRDAADKASHIPEIAQEAELMRIIALAQSERTDEREEIKAHLLSILETPAATIDHFTILANLQFRDSEFPAAKSTVQKALRAFPNRRDALASLISQLSIATSDPNFRNVGFESRRYP